MYDSKKVCFSCGWFMKYDSQYDIRAIGRYEYCPICGKKLNREAYSPDI